MAANPQKLKQIKEHGRRDILFSVARVPNSERIFVGSSDFGVYDVDLSKDKLEPKLLGKHGSYVTGVALAGKVLVSGSYDQQLKWWDVDGGKEIRTVDAHQKWIRGVFASPDGSTIASVADDMVCRLWDASSGKLIRELRGHKEKTPHHYPSMLYTCAFSSDAKLIATADKVGRVVVWERQSGKQLASVEAPTTYTWDPRQRRHSIGGIRSLAFSADGKSLAVGGIGKIGNIDHLGGPSHIEVFDWANGKQTHLFSNNSYKGLIQHLEFHPKGDWLLGAGGANDGFLLFHDLKTKKPVQQQKVKMHVHDLTMSESLEKLYLVGHGKIVICEMKG